MKTNKNINLDRVEEVAEGDKEFQSQLLLAIQTSLEDLKSRYLEGLASKNETILQQARHKIKPTLSLFELKRLSAILRQGKTLDLSINPDIVKAHREDFLAAIDDLLKELKGIIE